MGGLNDGSSSRCSISVARLKRLSARRKKPSRGRFELFISLKYSCTTECEARVPNRKFFVPPSGLKHQATTRASIRVDLPLPFSPTRKVTAVCSSRVSRWRTTGNENKKTTKEQT